MNEFIPEGKIVSKEIYIDILRRRRDVIRRKRLEKWRIKSFSFTTMLQRRGRFWSRFLIKEHCDNTAASPILSWPSSSWFFSSSLDWDQHWRDGAFVMLLTSIRMRRRAEKVFTKCLPGMFPSPLQSLTELCSYARGLVRRKDSLNDSTVFFISRNKVLPGTFLNYHIYIANNDISQKTCYSVT